MEARHDREVNEMPGTCQCDRLDEVHGQHVIPQTSTLEQTVAAILHTSGLADTAPLTPCPVRCPRCTAKRTGPAISAAGCRPPGSIGTTTDTYTQVTGRAGPPPVRAVTI
jgi:hypothetical protein